MSGAPARRLRTEHRGEKRVCPSEAHHHADHETYQQGDYHPITLVQYLPPDRFAPLCSHFAVKERWPRGDFRFTEFSEIS